jgi:hypothetical protein
LKCSDGIAVGYWQPRWVVIAMVDAWLREGEFGKWSMKAKGKLTKEN